MCVCKHAWVMEGALWQKLMRPIRPHQYKCSAKTSLTTEDQAQSIQYHAASSVSACFYWSSKGFLPPKNTVKPRSPPPIKVSVSSCCWANSSLCLVSPHKPINLGEMKKQQHCRESVLSTSTDAFRLTADNTHHR